MWWLRYFWLRLMFILPLVNIMTCVGAWYAVSSSYSNPKHRLVMVPYKNYIEISQFCRNCEVCYALGGLVRSTNMNNLDYCRSTTLKSKDMWDLESKSHLSLDFRNSGRIKWNYLLLTAKKWRQTHFYFWSRLFMIFYIDSIIRHSIGQFLLRG